MSDTEQGRQRFRVVFCPEEAQDLPQPGQGLATGLLDGGDRRGGCGGVHPDHILGGLCRHDHRAHLLGNQRLQLANHAGALRRHLEQLPCLLLGLKARVNPLEVNGQEPLRAHHAAHEPQQSGEQQIGGDRDAGGCQYRHSPELNPAARTSPVMAGPAEDQTATAQTGTTNT